MIAMLPNDQAVKEVVGAKDRDRLQGVWNYLTGRRKARLTIAGNAFTIVFANGDAYHGAVELDPTKKPKAMDLVIEEGPKHRGKTAACIYALDGDHLIWCPSEPGTGERPRAFPPTDSPNNLCIVFRKEKD